MSARQAIVKLLYISMLYWLVNVACGEKKIEVKNITGVRCTDCRIVFSAETTIISLTPEMARVKVTQLPEGSFIFDYKDTLCQNCILQRKMDAERSYQAGIKAYKSKDYATARQEFMSAIYKGHKDAAVWFEKSNDKILAIQKAEEVKTKKAPPHRYSSVTKGMFLNKQGWLNPGQQDSWGFYLQKGDKIYGELFGYNDMLVLTLISGGISISAEILVDRGTFTKLKWLIQKSGDYLFKVRNVNTFTKTDYILKLHNE